MKFVWVILIAGVVVTIRLWIIQARKRRQAADIGSEAGRVERPNSRPGVGWRSAQGWQSIERPLGDVGLVAIREIKERVRGRIFRVGTVLVLLVVGAAIIIPTFHHGGSQSTQTVAIVGSLSPEARQAMEAAGAANDDSIQFVPVPSLGAAEALLRSGRRSATWPLSDSACASCFADQRPRVTRRPIPVWSRTWPNISAC